jgi:homoserine O-acetyltransferase
MGNAMISRLVLLVCGGFFTPISQAEQLFATIDEMELSSGEVLRDCKIGYRINGELNDDKSNVIVFPTWFTGTTAALEQGGLIGPGNVADTNRYYVVAFDALANGVSCSPSNTDNFPTISTEDMVRSQYIVLTEQLGIDRVHAVIGISMGGMQTFRWLAMYPEFMDKAVPIDGSPQMTSYDLLQWQTHQEVIRAMKAGDIGEDGINKVLSRLNLLTLYTPDYFVENVGRADLPAFVKESDESTVLDPDDYVSQLEAMIDHDVLDADGNLTSKVVADILVVGVPSDQMVNAVPGKRLAEKIGTAYLEVESNCGHIGTSCEAELVSSKVNEFLAN